MCAAGAAQTVSVTVRSGNAPTGIDPDVRVLALPLGLPPPPPFGPEQFIDAQAAPNAYVPVPHSAWKQGLSTDPVARWVAVTPDAASVEPPSGLYVIEFDLPGPLIASASMDIAVAVDNTLGSSNNEGIYVNGVALAGTKAGPGVDKEVDYIGLDITNLVHAGGNQLYVYNQNEQGPGGVMFSATITATPLITWTDLGQALAGSAGSPELTGTGNMVAGALAQLGLTSAKPFSPSWLVIGYSAIDAPFKGGVMVPEVNLAFGLTTDFFGDSSFGGLWPAGVPSGFTTYFQWWIQDAAGPKGFAASNAVAGTAP